MFLSSACLCRSAISRGLYSGLFSRAACATTGTSLALPQQQKRFLGNEVRGPDFDPLNVNTWKLKPHVAVVSSGIYGRAQSYGEFKQFCESLRLLVFVIGSAALAADMLLIHPTRSAYWRSLSPLRWPGLFVCSFFGCKDTKGVFDYEQEGCTISPDGKIRTAAYAAFERMTR
ncbi:hypothetical protein, conserved [Eimeria tenella]|uniref:Uncharacterized protein n=1 Tax=Eimeria tenella TaxID=5802 RepID=U6KTY5_EIMTE|nr:hypothetical protein, conserved [Eimeria tenella]CDJ38930.1 hypothetical protein, conserved [Eimeria tenella]|eukprot:XP_013229685.1 hypothetical protein, conserved [Eimeria tenella]